MKRLFRPEILAAAILLTTALTVQAAPTMPSQQSEPVPPTASTSPGDPFVAGIRAQRVDTESYVMRCWVKEDEKFSNGNSVMVLMNTSTETIPKGTKIVITYADGTKKTLTAFVDIPPGGAVGIQGPPDATPDNFSCTASATEPVLPPSFSDAPTGNPAIPNP